jgi:hypothetical protein
LASALVALIILRFLPRGGNNAIQATGITIDLTVLSPLLYFLLIRRSAIPNITVVPVFIFGVLVAGVLLPSEDQQALIWIRNWLLPIVELVVIGVVIYHLVGFRRALKAGQHLNTDFFSALKAATSRVLPSKISDFLAMELAAFYYGFFYWKKSPSDGYTYHKTGGTMAILILVMLLVPIETVVLHLLIQQWNETIAWIFTIVSLYTALQLFGIIRSIKPRPIELLPDQLWLKYGILVDVHVPLAQITSIEKIKNGQAPEEIVALSPISTFEGCNLQLTSRKELTIIGLYGVKKRTHAIAFTVDQVDDFLEALGRKICLAEKPE